MEEQKGIITGSQFYDNTSRPYVAPPTESRRALALQKEQDYLVNKQNRNALEEVVNTLPYNPEDEGVYNSLKEDTMSFINKLDQVDNLEDYSLDIDGFANDFINKKGGRQIKEAATKVQTEMAVYDNAYESDDIQDPEMLDWYKSKFREKYIPITKDEETGDIKGAKVPKARYAKYVNISKNLEEVMKGWKENGTYVQETDPKTGMPTGNVIIGKNAPGYLNYTTGTSVPIQELYSSALAHIRTQPDAQAYLKDRADFKGDKVQHTPETLHMMMTPEISKHLFNIEDASIEDIRKEAEKGNLDIESTIKNLLYRQELMDSIELPSQKYSFSNIEPNFLEDKLLMQSLKQSSDLAKSRQEQQSLGTKTSVGIHNFTTQQEINPSDLDKLKENKQTLSEERKDLQGKINSYKGALTRAEGGTNYDELRRWEERVRVVDESIENLERQQESIDNSIEASLSTVGYNPKEVYQELLPQAREANISKNTELALKEGIDITDFTTVNEEGELTVDGNVLPKRNIITETVNGEERHVLKVGLRRGYDRTLQGVGEEYQAVISKILDENGEPTDLYKGNATLFNLATEEELKYVVTDLYSKMSSNFMDTGSDTRNYGYTNEKNLTFDVEGLKPYIEKLRNEKGDLQDVNITRDLSYITVEGDTTKDSLRAYTNFKTDIKQALNTNSESFKVGEVNLGQYLEENYGITNMLTEIDWEKTDINPLLQRDRQNGQLYGINLIPSKEGLENGDFDEAFAAANNLKITASYAGANARQMDNRVQDVLLKSFADIQDNLDSEYNVDVIKEAGRLYIDTSEYGKALDDLNLYVLNAGGEANWKVEGQDIKIKAVERDTRTKDLMDVDFVTNTVINGVEKAMVSSNGETGWVDKSELEADIQATRENPSKKRKYKQVIFESPSDIKKVFGAKLLNRKYQQSQQAKSSESDPYTAYLQSGYKRESSNEIKVVDYNSYRTRLEKQYGVEAAPTELTNNKGEKSFIDSRVSSSDLIDLRTDYENSIWSDNKYPYVHKNAYPYVKNILNTYDVLVTGGFRGETTHTNLEGADLNSPHKYGFGLDIEDNEQGNQLFDALVENEELRKKHNITRVLKHGGHIHLEFAESSI